VKNEQSEVEALSYWLIVLYVQPSIFYYIVSLDLVSY